MRTIYEEQLQGRVVVDATGRVIGEIDRLLVDSDAWKVEGFRVKLRREAADAIGAHRGTFRSATIVVPSSAVQSVSDTVVLREDASKFVTAEPDEDAA